MGECNIKPSTIFAGDNLDILRGFNSDCIDLIYLDPPFNSNENYAAPIGGEAAGAAFKDTWTLDDVDEAWVEIIEKEYPDVASIIETAGRCHSKGMQSYLTMMAIRLMELYRVLKTTGSIYLHCDHHAVHYLKAMMDSIFGRSRFKNEITWRRTEASKMPGIRYGNVTDSILFYYKSSTAVWNQPKIKKDVNVIPKSYRQDADGRWFRPIDVVALPAHGGNSPMYTYKGFKPNTRWLMTKENLKALDDKGLLMFSKSGRPYRIQYLDNHPGTPITNLWDDIKGAGHMPAKERTTFKTQKPLALLDRIIEASSNEGDMVLDPFCGCATACVSAEQHGRKWIGIDLSPLAQKLVVKRLKREIGSIFTQPIPRSDIPVRTDMGMIKNYKSVENINHLYGNQE